MSVFNASGSECTANDVVVTLAARIRFHWFPTHSDGSTALSHHTRGALTTAQLRGSAITREGTLQSATIRGNFDPFVLLSTHLNFWTEIQCWSHILFSNPWLSLSLSLSLNICDSLLRHPLTRCRSLVKLYSISNASACVERNWTESLLHHPPSGVLGKQTTSFQQQPKQLGIYLTLLRYSICHRYAYASHMHTLLILFYRLKKLTTTFALLQFQIYFRLRCRRIKTLPICHEPSNTF